MKKSEVVIIWLGMGIFILLAGIALHCNGNGIFLGLHRRHRVVFTLGIFVSALTALVIITVRAWSSRGPVEADWTTGLLRLYIVWGVVAFPLAWYVEDGWYFPETIVNYFALAITPWIVHGIVRWIVLPEVKWVREGFFLHRRKGIALPRTC